MAFFIPFFGLLVEYNQPALSFSKQLQRLKSQGLSILSEETALHYLHFIGYHRLKVYCIPFQKPDSSSFQEGRSFEDILDLYIFDRALRVLLLDAIERIEVAFRSVLSNVMAIHFGPHWYLSKKHFGNRYGNKTGRGYDHHKLLWWRQRETGPIMVRWPGPGPLEC